MIMAEQQKTKKTRKKSQKDEVQWELLTKEHKTKRRHEYATSVPICPSTLTSVPQRLKDLSETDDDDECLV